MDRSEKDGLPALAALPSRRAPAVWLTILLLAGGAAGCSEGDDGGGGGGSGPAAPPLDPNEIGAWDSAPQSYDDTRYVRPPGQSYGTGDGSSWTNAFADLPAELVRGVKYYLAAGDYDEHEPAGDAYVDYTFDDPDGTDGRFIGIFKATEEDHGTAEGWDSALSAGPARLGPLAFETGYYIIDGSEGQGDSGHGIHVAVKPGACDSPHSLALYFTWNAKSHFIGLHHLDVSHCGAYGNPQEPAQDAIYGYHTDDSDVSHVTIKHCYVHDTKRVLAFLLGWQNVLLEDSRFERSGQHHESSSLAMRAAAGVVVRRNVFIDAVNVYVSLQDVQSVYIYSNVFAGTIDGWEIWNSVHSAEPATNVLIYGNTFYNLTGLSTGLRFTGPTTNLQVKNNLFAHNRTNQIPIPGEHDYNAFWDNWRVDTEPNQDLSSHLDEEHGQILQADPFVDAPALDLHLATPTAAGAELPAPYDLDGDGALRGQDGVWDRGAFEHQQ